MRRKRTDKEGIINGNNSISAHYSNWSNGRSSPYPLDRLFKFFQQHEHNKEGTATDGVHADI